MSLIRLRRKNLFKACMAGMFMGMIVLGVLIVIGFAILHETGILESQSPNKKGTIEVYQLKRAMSAGQVIQEVDLKKSSLPKEKIQGYATVRSDLIGKELRLSLEEGTILTKDMIIVDKEESNDMRQIRYDFIKLTEKITIGDYIDIRISYSNGADFILLSKKKVEDLSATNQEGVSNMVWLKVSEEELLRVSSAVVDAYLNDGCIIYAVEYLSSYQKQAVVNYPVNQIVEKLITEDPNIVTKAKNVLISTLRSELNIQENPDDNAMVTSEGVSEDNSIYSFEHLEDVSEGDTSADLSMQEQYSTEELYTNDKIEYLE